jgi:hypothetical protein
MGAAYDEELGLWMALGHEEMWTSTDGMSWERHEVVGQQFPDHLPTPSFMTDVTRWDGSLWASGVFNGGDVGAGDYAALLVWTTENGEDWEIVPQDAGTLYLVRAIAASERILAVANRYYGQGDGSVATSDDAASWTESRPGGPGVMVDIDGDGEGFVAVGYRIPDPDGLPNVYQPAIWRSDAGGQWSDVSPEADGELSQVIHLAPGWVASGSRVDGTTGVGNIVLWQSDDGADWTPVDLPGASISSFYDGVQYSVLAAADGVALLIASDGAGALRCWTSRDGWSWHQTAPVPAEFSASASVTLVKATMSADQVLLFADDIAYGGEDTKAWLGVLTPE